MGREPVINRCGLIQRIKVISPSRSNVLLILPDGNGYHITLRHGDNNDNDDDEYRYNHYAYNMISCNNNKMIIVA